MDLDSIECVSSSDGMDEDEIQHHNLHPHPNHHSEFSSTKPRNGPANTNKNMGPTAISPATSVHELLECPVCTNSMYPPIHQCHNGHTLCSTCKTRLHNRCPTCQQELGDIRCLALEKVAESLELPCNYYSLGCPEIFPFYSKLKHEAVCNFRPYNCPYAGSECAVVGVIPYLVAHLRDDHKVDMCTGCTFNHRYVKSNPCEVENATWMLTVFNCFGQYFCLHFEAFQLGMAPVYMAFLFMVDENEAKIYSYSLEVGGNGRKLSWEGTPRTIQDSHRKVRDSHDGLIIQRNVALFFSGGDGKELKLRVRGRIWKELPNPDAGCHNGHTLCSTCKTRVHNRSHTCPPELGDIRCLALEKVAESLELPCKYYSLGCPEIFPYYKKFRHEAVCNFRPYNCPYPGSECAVVGDIPYLVAHLRDDHKVDMHTGCTFNHRYVKSNPREVENATWMLTLGMASVYMAFLRFMGDENEARNYSYSLEVGGNGRKLSWEGTPRSIRDSHCKVRDSHGGLIIQRNVALFFSGGDGKELKLRVRGRIWKE